MPRELIRRCHFNTLQHHFSGSPVCCAVVSVLLHLPTSKLFQLSATMERGSHDVSKNTWIALIWGSFRKNRARSRMASLKHSRAQAILSSLFFLFEHTVSLYQAASVMYLSHSCFLIQHRSSPTQQSTSQNNISFPRKSKWLSQKQSWRYLLIF